MSTVDGLLERASRTTGGSSASSAKQGIGKTRLIRYASATAAARGVEVFTTACESHAGNVPFHTVARFVRTVTGVGDLEREQREFTYAPNFVARIPGSAADRRPSRHWRPRSRAAANPCRRTPEAPDRNDQRGIDGRRAPGLFILEDAHWIDKSVSRCW